MTLLITALIFGKANGIYESGYALCIAYTLTFYVTASELHAKALPMFQMLVFAPNNAQPKSFTSNLGLSLILVLSFGTAITLAILNIYCLNARLLQHTQFHI